MRSRVSSPPLIISIMYDVVILTRYRTLLITILLRRKKNSCFLNANQFKNAAFFLLVNVNSPAHHHHTFWCTCMFWATIGPRRRADLVRGAPQIYSPPHLLYSRQINVVPNLAALCTLQLKQVQKFIRDFGGVRADFLRKAWFDSQTQIHHPFIYFLHPPSYPTAQILDYA